MATKQSQSLRRASEQRISEYIQDQIKQVATAESELKRQVQVLWRTFQESVENVVEGGINIDASSAADNRVTRDEWPRPDHRRSSHSSHDSPRPSIRQFSPNRASPLRPTAPPTLAGPSALSSSLASSAFYHPAANQSQSTIANSSEDITTNGRPNTPLSGTTLSPEEHSPRTSDALNISGSLRRNFDAVKDLATSLRYESVLKAEAFEREKARRKGEPVASSSKSKEAKEVDINDRPQQTIEKGPSPTVSEPVIKSDGTGSTAESDKPLSSKKKGKRKVTFDVEPAIVTITREIDSEKNTRSEVVDINGTRFLHL